MSSPYHLRERVREGKVNYYQEKVTGHIKYKRGPYKHTSNWISKGDLREQLQRADRKNGELQQVIENYKTTTHEMADLREQLECVERKNGELQQNIENYKIKTHQTADLRVQLECVERKNGELLQILTNANKEIENNKISITTQETEISQLYEKLSLAEENKRSLQQNLSNKNEFIIQQKQKIDLLTFKINEMKFQKDAIKNNMEIVNSEKKRKASNDISCPSKAIKNSGESNSKVSSILNAKDSSSSMIHLATTKACQKSTKRKASDDISGPTKAIKNSGESQSKVSSILSSKDCSSSMIPLATTIACQKSTKRKASDDSSEASKAIKSNSVRVNKENKEKIRERIRSIHENGTDLTLPKKEYPIIPLFDESTNPNTLSDKINKLFQVTRATNRLK